ncbi:MAG: PilZ domain-containing protein [Lachnospiraceae bacterium]|nr:PilZ domain-containing protein [Lachnospiraceae bacterium]
MRIEELAPSQAITLLIHAGNQQLEFPSTVLESFPRKRMILTSPVMKNDKIISFNGKGIITHVIVYFPDQKPIVFQNVTIQTTKDKNDALCYMISSLTESKEFNRRGAFRCYIGIDTHVRVGSHKGAVEATIKDISSTGFAFATRCERTFAEGDSVHAVVNDYIEETAKSYSFHLLGTIVRHYEMDNGLTVYGCQFKAKVVGLDSYLVEKERIRLQRSRASNASAKKETKK